MKNEVHASWTLLPRLHELDALSDACTRAAVTLAVARAEDDAPEARVTVERLARLGEEFYRAQALVTEGITLLRGDMEASTTRLHERVRAGESLAAVHGTLDGKLWLFDYSRALELLDQYEETGAWTVDRTALHAIVEAMGAAEVAVVTP
ncbi:hypothetical protein BST28_17555 [Mycolicibacter kumamotonensis]|uniref:Uncharacterized protein n=2 Tax=Mycolicibacter kumamotonensis TaxID=354243 RepID=A0A1X0DZB3_9MYCO|nr:hypothetical protein BST28_17555 [Mycolicibacter kumamotonensis]